MKHIPHITIKTNLVCPEQIIKDKSCQIQFKGPISKFPSMYENDPLAACGFYCNIDIPTEHEPHMTLWYNYEENLEVIDTPDPTHGQLFLADTRSLDPSEWRLIY